jgi:hypothetical protein
LSANLRGQALLSSCGFQAKALQNLRFLNNSNILQNNDILLKSSNQSNILWKHEKQDEKIIIDKIDIGKYFNVNTENQIVASILKDIMNQITIDLFARPS